MGLNLVESFIVAAAANYCVGHEFASCWEVTREERAALRVIDYGMLHSGFLFRPGLIHSPDEYFSKGLAGFHFLTERR